MLRQMSYQLTSDVRPLTGYGPRENLGRGICNCNRWRIHTRSVLNMDWVQICVRNMKTAKEALVSLKDYFEVKNLSKNVQWYKKLPSNGVIRDGVGNSGHFLSSLIKSSVSVFPPKCWFHLLYKSFMYLIKFVWSPVNLAFLPFCSWCASNWGFSSACIIIKSARCILLWIAYFNSQTSNGSKFKGWDRLGDIFFPPHTNLYRVSRITPHGGVIRDTTLRLHIMTNISIWFCIIP